MTQPWRVAGGGCIDRSRPLTFEFDGCPLQGYEGDTLASALLANGVRMVGRSFKYHRPRGIVAAGHEEPNALLRLLDAAGGGRPNTRATTLALADGMRVRSQHHWPSLRFDLGAAADRLSRFLSAGFYYKTFMWPRRGWPLYEHVLRRAAGLGAPPDARGAVAATQRQTHVTLLIAGGGPAGLAAALEAGTAGTDVLLADDGALLGGRLLDDVEPDRRAWLATTLAALRALPNVTLLYDTVVSGYHDHDYLSLVQSADGGRTLWKVRARRVVIATGAVERPLVFPGNDRPGVMLAAAVLTYLRRYGVLCGRNAVLCTSDDSAYAVARALREAGANVPAVLDTRPDPGAAATAARAAGIHVVSGATLLGTHGRYQVEAIRWQSPGRPATSTACDLLAMAGGWTPRVHLHSQARGTLRFAPDIGSFVPDRVHGANRSAGACRGVFDTDGCIADGRAAAGGSPPGETVLGVAGTASAARTAAAKPPEATNSPAGKAFVDFQNDVTTADIAMAAREGYRSVEHLKRYTTLGMGTDQGKLGNIDGLTILARLTGREPGQVGTTTFRPPYVPVDVSVLAGPVENHPAHPVRRLATHDWHAAHGAVFTTAGAWLRPQFYRRTGETDLEAVDREALAVRAGVGLVDVSPLGKIELHGRDAAQLLNRLYVNRWDKLAVGRAKFGVILRDDGMVLDDSVVARLGEHHYVMSTSTAHSKVVPEHIAWCLHALWPELRVHVTPVSEQWVTYALAGPRAREVLSAMAPDFDVAAAAMPHMSVRSGRLGGVATRVTRMSFSGELSYEISVPAEHASDVWQGLFDAGQAHALTVYGTEAMGVLRIEKGHFVVGREAAGTSSLDDLGLGGMLDPGKDCIGKRSLALPALRETDRMQLVGVQAVEPGARIAPGSHLVTDRAKAVQESLGAMTSQCHSPTLRRSIGLGLVRGGRARIGQTLYAVSPVTGESARVEIVAPCFVDPKGERLHG